MCDEKNTSADSVGNDNLKFSMPSTTRYLERLYEEGKISQDKYYKKMLQHFEEIYANTPEVLPEVRKNLYERIYTKPHNINEKLKKIFRYFIYSLLPVFLISYFVYYMKNSEINLYNIHYFCKFPLFLIFAYVIMFFSVLSIICYLSNPQKPHIADSLFLNILCGESKIKTIIVTAICIFFTLFSSSNFVLLLGCDDIRVMPKGTYCYYVYATNEKGNTYTLPAEIHKNNKTKYGIEYVYFKNGGYLYFPNVDYTYFPEESYIEYGYTFIAYDQNDNKWQIKLTPYKTTHPEVVETSPLNIGILTIIFISAVLLLIDGIFYIFRIDYEKKLREKNQIPNEVPMTEKDIGLMYSWDEYIIHLQVSRSNIEKYLEEHTIENIRNAYLNNYLTEEQYKIAEKHIKNIELLNDIISKRLDDIIDNQNMLLDKYYIE